MTEIEEWVRGAGRFLAELVSKLEVWWEKPETQAAFARILALPAEVEARLKQQRRFLRKGLLPSVPLLTDDVELEALTPEVVADKYANTLKASGYDSDALIMRQIGEVAALGFHDFTMRIIYPENEAVTRLHVYDSNATDGMASLLEMRAFVLGFLTEGSTDQTAQLMSLERFVFLHLAAADVTYARTKAKRLTRNRRIFAKVANRHRVCHGLVSQLEPKHVINGLTLLYSATVIGRFMLSQGLRVHQGTPRIDILLAERTEARRTINQETLSLLRSFPKFSD